MGRVLPVAPGPAPLEAGKLLELLVDSADAACVCLGQSGDLCPSFRRARPAVKRLGARTYEKWCIRRRAATTSGLVRQDNWPEAILPRSTLNGSPQDQFREQIHFGPAAPPQM
jgi:hypothetical protein